MRKSKKKTEKKSRKDISPDAPIPCQIYLLTPPKIDDVHSFGKILDEVLTAAPIACLQIRLKDTSKKDIINIANILIPIARRNGTLVLINDDPEIVRDCGADGVHLGQSDMNINLAKQVLPKGAIVGVTCHNSKELAFSACSDGANYIAFGAFFISATKPSASTADLEILTWWQNTIEIPCVAIGGITPDNACKVISAGADFVALSSGVWDYKHGPVEAVKRLEKLCLASPSSQPLA